MNDRDIPSVPITTLAGVASLTGLLPEMPLPTPLPKTLSNKSLLFHPRVAEEAQNLLGMRDDSLVPQLVQSLLQTSADHIELKDNYDDAESRVNRSDGLMPELLKAMFETNSTVFMGSTNHVPCAPIRHHENTILQGNPTGCALNVQQAPLSGYGQISPSGSRHTPQGSPASPASARLPHLPPPNNRPTVITEQTIAKDISNNIGVNDINNYYDINNQRQSAVNNGIYMQKNNSSNEHISQIDHLTHNLREQEHLPRYPSRVASNVILNDQIAGRLTNMRGPSPAQASDAPAPVSVVFTSEPIITSKDVPDEEVDPLGPDPLDISPHATYTERSQDPPQFIQQDPQAILSQQQISPVPMDGTFLSEHQDADASNDANCGNHNWKKKSEESVVRLIRINEEDMLQLQQNVHTFVQKKPRLANKLGLVDTDNKMEDEAVMDDQTSNDSNDPEFLPEEKLDSFSALKRKRTFNKISSSDKTDFQVPVVKPKLRKLERKFVPVIKKLSEEELMETNTYQLFIKEVDKVLESTEDFQNTEVDDEDINSDVLLPRYQLNILCSEAAKLKSIGAMASVPSQRLIGLLNVLEMNVRAAVSVSPISDPNEDDGAKQMWMETTLERVMGAVEASLITMYIMTSKDMPKRIYIEDIIDRIICFIQFQLRNTIYPSYDATHRVDNNKKKDRKRKNATAGRMQEKALPVLYGKLHELVRLLSELLAMQHMTDTTILHMSSMGVSPFFVENMNELQLSCLKLVTMIFTQYERHRKLLLDDILASMARLPSIKRNLRLYKLDTNVHIQMVTALVLQMIQCVVVLPESLGEVPKSERESNKNADGKTTKVTNDKDCLVNHKYDTAVNIGGVFLEKFLNKCKSRSEEIDFRPLFENFVHDLLATVNKPQWPAAELLLNLLGTLLMKYMSDKSIDMSIRLASLEYLGLVTARIRKDSVNSLCKVDIMDQMIRDIKAEEQKDGESGDNTNIESTVELDVDEERIQFLQRVLLDFLAVNGQDDPAWAHARHFYLTQWYRDNIQESKRLATGGKHRMHLKKVSKKKKYHNDKKNQESSSDQSDYSEHEDEIDKIIRDSDQQQNSEVYRLIDQRKMFLLSKIKPFHDTFTGGNRVQIIKTYINYNDAEIISQYLASKKIFSQSFDTYLRKMIMIICEPSSIAIRTKVMKCMTMIVDVDPAVLARNDMSRCVSKSLMDQATSVRESAIDLLGKFMLSQTNIVDQYYDVLMTRILDTGVSVRKRVIKILRDICIQWPLYPKIPEICVRMIRRVNDEEGIRKLVIDVFQDMWFKPVNESTESEYLKRKVQNITAVVMSSKDTGTEHFENLLKHLFKPKEDKDDSTKIIYEPPQSLIQSCTQIVECLINNIISLDHSQTATYKLQLAGCVSTLDVFAKIRPKMLVKHALTLEPYMIWKCQTANDLQIVSCVASIMELIIPLVEHPSETFLARIEEAAIRLILQQSPKVISSCLSCLGAIVNNVTKNFQLIRDLFTKIFYTHLKSRKEQIEKNPSVLLTSIFNSTRPVLRRSLYILGLMLRHFDFTDKAVIEGLEDDIKNQVFEVMLFLLKVDDKDIQLHTLKALGSVCVRHYELMLGDDIKNLYCKLLEDMDAPLDMKTEVLKNIEVYLQEEEKRMIKQDLEWDKNRKLQNLKEMGDVSSGMASAVIQVYIKDILTAFINKNLQIRIAAMNAIALVLQQGLVHPVQIVPYLICMSTDNDKRVSGSADNQLQDIEKKYPGFINMKSQHGILLSYQLQRLITGVHSETDIVRGYRISETKGEYPSALNGYLYSILRNTKPTRRALVYSILKQFEDQKTSLLHMLYLADNLAYFPYQALDEPLYIIHQIDISISINGANLLQSFREGLNPSENQNFLQAQDPTYFEDEDEEDPEDIFQRLPEDTTLLQGLITAAQGCLLLLHLKQHLKTIYNLSDGKISQYSPSESSQSSKLYERVLTRRHNNLFDPANTIKKLKEGPPPELLDNEARKRLINEYLEFKQLMLKLDPDDVDDEDKVTAVPQVSRPGAENNSDWSQPQGSAGTSTAASLVNSVKSNGREGDLSVSSEISNQTSFTNQISLDQNHKEEGAYGLIDSENTELLKSAIISPRKLIRRTRGAGKTKSTKQ